MSDVGLTAPETPVEPFAVVAGLIALVSDPKASAARLKALEAALAEVGRERAALAADKAAAEAEISQRRAAFEAECVAARAALELSTRARDKREADLTNRERENDRRAARSKAIEARWEAMWRQKWAAEGGGADNLRSVPGFLEYQMTDEPVAQRYRADPSGVAEGELTQTDPDGRVFPAGVSIARRSMRRGMEA
jgi:hypothetical protein